MTLLLLQIALAQTPDWQTKPYVRPRINLRAITVNGNPSLQGVGGAEGGLYFKYRDKPYWLVNTRLSAVAMYGFASGSLGYDIRLGAFAGPDGKIARYQVGPDFWYNGYGQPGAPDYYLPPSFGISLPNTIFFKIYQPWIGALLGVTPSWVFNPDRVAGMLGPIHQLNLMGAFVFDIEGYGLTVGYQRTWTSAGVIDGLILSGSL